MVLLVGVDMFSVCDHLAYAMSEEDTPSLPKEQEVNSGQDDIPSDSWFARAALPHQ